MTKFQRTVLLASLGIIFFVVVLGIAGDYDYCDQVILSMSQEQYDSITELLTEQNGFSPTDRDIAHYWMEHHQK